MGPRPILKLDPTTSESIVSEPIEPYESTSGSPDDIRHLPPAKAKPGPLPLPFSSCTQAQFLFLEHSPHVHFPPTPRLVRPGITHSSSTYDRAPIEVSPNQCELPARGCRVYETGGGTGAIRSQMIYTPGPGRKPSSMIQPVKMKDGDIDGYFDPRAFEACRRTVVRSGQEEDEGNVDDDREAHTRRSDSPCSSSSSSSSSESESEPDESSYTQEISAPSSNHDPFVQPPSPTTRMTLTLLPYPCSYPLQSVASRLRKKRSSNSCGGAPRGWRRKLPPTRSRSVDGYARWNLDANNGINAHKSSGDMSISDHSLDGCLGGF